MPTVWWDDPRQYRTDARGGSISGNAQALQQGGGSVPEAIPRAYWSDWDRMAIGAYEVPGHVVVVSKKQKKFDVLDVQGQDFATINHLGVDPVELDITITIWTPDQFSDYERLVNLITPKAFPRPGSMTQPMQLPPGVAGPPEAPRPTSASSFAIRHPPLNMMGVTDVYVYEIGQLIPGPVYGAKVATWRAMERKPPQQTMPQASTGGLYAAEVIDRPRISTQPTTSPAKAGIPP